MTLYIEPAQGLAVVERLGFHVRDAGLFVSALSRPAASIFGDDAYPSIELKAAAMLASLTRNHALIDGNKRTAWVLTVAFLNINGWDVEMTQDEKYDLILDTAQGRLELGPLAAALAAHLVAEG